jgi:hypothetical protein
LAFTAAVAAGLLALPATARADLVTVTPDSISHPPRADAGSFGLNDLVIDQYRGVGLAFRFEFEKSPDSRYLDGVSTVIETRGDAHAWVGANVHVRDFQASIWSGNLDPVTADLVVPGTQTPATTDTLRLKFSPPRPEVHGGAYNAWVDAYDKAGKLLLSASRDIGSGVDPWLALDAPGIHSFSARASDTADWEAHNFGPLQNGPPWGIAAVAFDQAPQGAPEPSGLVLGGLGVLGLAGFLRKRWPAAGHAPTRR